MESFSSYNINFEHPEDQAIKKNWNEIKFDRRTFYVPKLHYCCSGLGKFFRNKTVLWLLLLSFTIFTFTVIFNSFLPDCTYVICGPHIGPCELQVVGYGESVCALVKGDDCPQAKCPGWGSAYGWVFFGYFTFLGIFYCIKNCFGETREETLKHSMFNSGMTAPFIREDA
jgi:hypothetical protein